MIPGTPLAGTADPNPLLTLDRYTWLTKDEPSEPDFDKALADALDMTARECVRNWLYGRYEERLFLYPTGMVFPSATPLDASKPVVSGQEVFDPSGQPSASVIQGAGIWVGWFTPLPWMPVWTGVIPPQTDVIYWGGYTQATVPAKLARIWARIIYYSLHPVALQGLPSGAKSVSIGGVSVSGNLSMMTAADPQLAIDIQRFRRPQARGWET